MALPMYISGLYTFEDGWTVSIVGGFGKYSTPSQDCSVWTEMEFGYPSSREPLIEKYVDGYSGEVWDDELDDYRERTPEEMENFFTKNVYAWVPVRLIPLLEEKHGKIVSIKPYHR